MPAPSGLYFGGYFGGFFGGTAGGGGGGGGAEPAPVVYTAATLAAWNRLAEQFRHKPKILGLVDALVAPVQPIADAIAALLLQQSVDAAFGAQLDVLGKKIGQPRAGLDDETYRRYLRARVASNRSKGVTEDLIGIVNLVLGVGSGAGINVQQQKVATIDVRITSYVPDDATTTAILTFLRRGAAAGVRVLLEILTAAESDSFECATADTTLATAATTADTFIDVVSTDGFPDSGSLDIDANLAVAETVTYTGRLATRFLGVSALAHNHAGPSGANAGAVVQRTDDPGKGFGDDVDLTAGGKLVEIVE